MLSQNISNPIIPKAKNPIIEGQQFFTFSTPNTEATFIQKKGKQWIETGENNDLYEFIESLLDISPTHAACIAGTVQWAVGESIEIPTDPKALEFFTNHQTSRASAKNLGELAKSLLRDLVVFSSCFISVVWRKDGRGYTEISYVDPKSVRPDVDGDGFWISTDWSKWKKEDHTPVFFARFSDEDGQRKGTQILEVRIPNPRKTPISLPLYWSVKDHILLDGELLTMNRSRVQNGFHSNLVFRWPEAPSLEEQTANYEARKKFYAGASNSSKAMDVFGQGIEIDQIESTVMPADVMLLQSTIDRKISIGHRVPNDGQLFGIGLGDGGMTFSVDSMKEEASLFQSTVVSPIQFALTDAYTTLALACGIDHEWIILPFQLTPIQEDGEVLSEDGTIAPTENVQASAMNGAQVESLISIITQIGSGVISKTTGKPLIQAAFPALGDPAIDAMLAGIPDVAPAPINPIPSNE
ncbi:MAG TPA: hypothetical protein VGE21_02635 [Flavobacteriales bacterium]